MSDKVTQTNRPPNATPAEVEEAKMQLRNAIHGSNEVLFTAKTVFPFTFFPDTVTVDRAKFTLMKRSFFSVAEVMSIRVEDVLNVTANVGPVFGSIHVVSRIMNTDKPYEIKFLWRDDAIALKRILQGYIIAVQKEIDTTPLKTQELADMLKRLGEDDHSV